jgi:hypothetical protein
LSAIQRKFRRDYQDVQDVIDTCPVILYDKEYLFANNKDVELIGNGGERKV